MPREQTSSSGISLTLFFQALSLFWDLRVKISLGVVMSFKCKACQLYNTNHFAVFSLSRKYPLITTLGLKLFSD
jgi:hypothetical protein